MIEGKTTENQTRQILFVCTANVCRSPMAEAIFNALAEERGLAWRAESAGVAALVGEDILEEADLVLGMGPRHVGTLRRRFGDLSERVYALPQYALGAPPEEGIPDPYGQTMTAFRASVRQLLEYTEALVGRLEREEALR